MWRSLVAVAVFSMVGSVASAAGVLIDDFSSGATTISASTSVQTGLSNVWQGVREGATGRPLPSGGVGNNNNSATINTSGAGTYSFRFNNTASGATATEGQLWYDGNTGGGFNATTAGTNFLTGGEVSPPKNNSDFYLQDFTSNGTVTVKVTLSAAGASSNLGTATYTVASTGGVAEQKYLSFSALTSATTLDMTKINRIKFEFIVAAGSDVSFSVSKIMASTPEPGTFALLGMGAVGLVVAHRRRKAKAN